MIETKSNFTFVLEGDRHDLPVDDLIGTLGNLNLLLSTTSTTYCPEAKSQLKINATQSGSFQIFLETAILASASFFTPANIQTAKHVFDIIKTFFEIRKHIGNNPPNKIEKQKDKTVVENSYGISKDFSKDSSMYFDNPTYENCIINVINIGDNNSDVNGISIYEEGKKSLDIPRSEFNRFRDPVIKEPLNDKETTLTTDVLFVKQGALMGDAQWTFASDKTFKACIEDKEWLDEYVQGKYPLVPKTKMHVELEKTYDLDKEGFPIEDKVSYRVMKVLKIIYPDEYLQMKFDEV